ncbi:MAG: hypothetical protein SGILL_004558 [Bacillariaceae sp.]
MVTSASSRATTCRRPITMTTASSRSVCTVLLVSILLVDNVEGFSTRQRALSSSSSPSLKSVPIQKRQEQKQQTIGLFQTVDHNVSLRRRMELRMTGDDGASDEEPEEAEEVIEVVSIEEDKDNTSATTSTTSMADKVAGRKKRLQMGYKLSSSIYMVASLLHLLRRGFYSWSLYYVFGGGTFTMAMLLFILKGAASANGDRLSSDTYKRLNLSVIAYALLQLLLPVSGWIDRLFFKLPALLAIVNGIKGYGYGVLGWDKAKEKSAIITDIKDVFTSSVKSLTSYKYSKESIGYVIGTAFVGAMGVVKVMELFKTVLFPGAEAANKSMMILSRVSRIARLGLMTSIMYTLKDAADRGRLSGTTFVQLNYLMTAAFLTMTFYLSPLGPTPLGTISGGLSVLTLYNGVTQEKKE